MSDVNAQITSAMESALSGQGATPEVPVVPVTPEVTPPQPVSTPQAVNLSDDALVTFKIDGKEITKPWSEVRQTQALLPGDYTRKTQALATERAAWEARKQSELAASQSWQQERTQVLNALKDPQKVGALYLAALGQAKAQGQSPQQAQATAQAAVSPEALLAQIDDRLNQRFSEHQNNIKQQEIASDMDTFLGSIKKGTLIEDLPGIDDYVYGQVEAMKPKTIDEAKGFVKLVFDEYASKFSAKISNAQKASVISQSKLTNGIEPPGGTITPTVPKSYKNDRDPQRVEDILAFMKQRLAEA